MKIKRSVLEKIIREELANHLKSLIEATPEKSPEVKTAHDDKKEKETTGGKGDKKKVTPQKAPTVAGKDKSKEPSADAEEPDELPTPEEPADKEIEKDVASGEEDAEDAEDVTGGKIADEVTGQTVQSLTMDPKSKIMPGAQEIVITFREKPDPLRILIGKTGIVKFYYRGLHNEL